MSKSTAPSIDPITSEVIRNKLSGIANEMQSILLRSSFSPIVREGLDASAALFTVEGETLSQAVAIPNHLATMIPMIGEILKEFPIAGMKEGDLYLSNDPYIGGTHLPDICMVMPLFSAGRVVALSTTITHHQDIGGMTPGSIPTNATEIFQEGLRLPPLQLRYGWDEWNDTLLKVMKLNTRIPDIFIGDLNAQVAACSTGARRMAELAGGLGGDLTMAIFADLLDRSERMTRAALSRLPAGRYHYVDQSDNDGVDLDKPIRIEAEVTIGDGVFRADFSKSSDQVRGPFNAVPSGAKAAVFWALRVITGTDIPTNGGCFRAAEIITRPGSVLDPIEPAPVNSRTATIKRASGVIMGALREILPETIGADAGGEMLALSFGGRDAQGRSFVMGEIIASGSGAWPGGDGVDVIETDATNCMNMPVEAVERDAPLRMVASRLARDTGGAGTYRGGLGIEREYIVLAPEVRVTYRGERHFFPAQGAEGGGEGGLAMAYVARTDGSKEDTPSKLVTTLYQGDRIFIRTAGGGGWGDPKARPQAQVAQDIADGKVSAEAALNLYDYLSERAAV